VKKRKNFKLSEADRKIMANAGIVYGAPTGK